MLHLDKFNLRAFISRLRAFNLLVTYTIQNFLKRLTRQLWKPFFVYGSKIMCWSWL